MNIKNKNDDDDGGGGGGGDDEVKMNVNALFFFLSQQGFLIILFCVSYMRLHCWLFLFCVLCLFICSLSSEIDWRTQEKRLPVVAFRDDLKKLVLHEYRALWLHLVLNTAY